MTPTQEHGLDQSIRPVASKRTAKAYILLHAVVVGCTCLVGSEHLISLRWVPSPVYFVIHSVVMFGYPTFVLTSPIVASVMIFVLSRRDREWLYLGICDAALFILHIVGLRVACS